MKQGRIFYKSIAVILAVLHLSTFGPVGEALAFYAESASYKIHSGTFTLGRGERVAAGVKIAQDTLGEPIAAKSQSINYILNSGFIPTILDNPSFLAQKIPYQTWPINTAKPNAFDLDDYFLSPEGKALAYSVSGNSQITITIDPDTHIVSFASAQDWAGVEKVYFYAQDTDGNLVTSNHVALQVVDPAGPDKPVIIETQLTPSFIKEGDLITLTVKACDLDNEPVSFTYNTLFTETNRYSDGTYWYSEAVWQTNSASTGHYSIRITVKDSVNLSDSEDILVNVGNSNNPPALNHITDITANEGDLVTIAPTAADADGDTINFYYGAPFDTTGKWLTNCDSAGSYSVLVTASDGIDTVSQSVNITVNNTNRPPQATLTLSKYTLSPNEQTDITLFAYDPDGDAMDYQVKKDSEVISSGAYSSVVTLNAAFSDLGDYTISAVVTDAQGLAASDSKGVDVADPNANRDYINPVMGDFNGDCLADLGIHNSQDGKWEICLSDGGVFRNAVDWLSNFGASRDWWPMGGDFNGDGKTDIAAYNNTNGELQVALSSGSGFTASGTWLSANVNYSWLPATGNFNADKYTDFLLYNKDTGEVKVALGTGTGFGAFSVWLTGFGADYIPMVGDFNGDSLSDLCLFKKSSGEFKVAFSNSKEFVDGASWLSGFGADKDALISDFNNDGLTDVGYWDKDSGVWHYAISTGSVFVDKGEWLSNFGAGSDDSATTGDFNGDGVIDAACFDRDQLGILRWRTQLSTDKPADLLTEIDNGIGGKTQVSYTYAATSDNDLLPFPVYVASSISLVNSFPADRAATYTQNFIFYGGYYDAVEREFRGFAKVKVTDPITDNYTETYFYQGKPGQDGALKGQIEKLLAYDANNRLISQTLNTYEVRKSGPFANQLGAPFLIEQDVTAWEENNTSLSTKNKTTYDNIGNILEEFSEGDIAQSGDEKSTAATYAQAYEVGFDRPLEIRLKDKDGAIVSQKAFVYDSNGNLSEEEFQIFDPLTIHYTLSTTHYFYDSFGNLVSTVNANGASVTTDYETTFYTYPEKVTNALGHFIQYTYDPNFGAVTKTIDPNGFISEATYDSLGRITQQLKNSITQVTFSYPDFNTKISTNAIGLSSTEYIDGLGRKYKTVSVGEDGNSPRQVTAETYFNNRGLTDKESLPYYIDEDSAQVSYVRYEYDLRGRVTKTISDFPGEGKDASASVSYLSPLYTETTDPQGHKKGTLKDIFGNIIEVSEFTSSGTYKTTYQYDIQNNLTKTIDSHGNTAQIWYDSLGRKLKMEDPDMGVWTYEYDLLGNLLKQTDAKGQDLEFSYDSLNRLTGKLANGQTIVTYQYDDASKSNCIGRLSKIIDQSGSTEFFYDNLGRETKSIKEVSGIKYQVSREYDILDRLTKLAYPDGENVSYAYDVNSGLLEKVTGQQDYVKDITYSANGQMRAIQYGNGVTTDYTYGQDLRLSRIFTSGVAGGLPGGGGVGQDLNYVFDKNGNLTTLTDNLKSNIRTFSYDDLDRLIDGYNIPSGVNSYTSHHYQYDSIGNMIYKSDVGVMTYGLGAGPHALTSAGGYSYQYDANGNMIVGKNKTLAYDIENRLTSVVNGSSTESYLYDGDGGRVKKSTVNGQQSTETIYIGSLFENDSDGKTRKHIFAGSNRICSIQVTGDGGQETSYYHSDHLGSSSIITDGSGNQAAHYEYAPYGSLTVNELTNGQTGQPVNHFFTGKELDSTGLYFYGARYYDPEIGHFITADTIVQSPFNPQTLNRYSYCGNNPINYIDPTGHWSWKKFWHAAVGALVGVAATLVLGPGGALAWYGWTMAGVIGGAMGGAITGGLEGGWKGALIGAGMGGALGGFGGWGGSNFGWGFGAGMLVAGAGVAGATNSWDSFAGGITGGLAGTAIGNGINSFSNEFTGSGQPGVNRNDLAAQNEQLKQSQRALDVKLDEQIRIGSRDAVGPADHMFVQRQSGNIVEMGPAADGNITVFQYNPKDYINPASRINLASTQKHTLSALYDGKLHLQWSRYTDVSSVGLNNLIKGYGNIWSGAVYAAGSNNSNTFVNTVVYGAGGQITGLNTLRPSFSTYRDDR